MKHTDSLRSARACTPYGKKSTGVSGRGDEYPLDHHCCRWVQLVATSRAQLRAPHSQPKRLRHYQYRSTHVAPLSRGEKRHNAGSQGRLSVQCQLACHLYRGFLGAASCFPHFVCLCVPRAVFGRPVITPTHHYQFQACLTVGMECTRLYSIICCTCVVAHL